MIYLAWAYVGAFVLFGMFTLFDGIRDRDPVFEIVAEAFSFGVLAIGCGLWIRDEAPAVSPILWLPLFVTAVTLETIVILRGRARTEAPMRLKRLADFTIPVLFAPAILMNVLYLLESYFPRV